jgi:predicted nuclease with TOPRIM domain
MARGKHRAASQRRYDQHATTDLQSLRDELAATKHALVTAEAKAKPLDQLRERLVQVTAERDTIAAPEVARLTAMVQQLQEELREARKEYKHLRDRWQKVLGKILDLLNLKGVEGWEALYELLGEPTPTILAKIDSRKGKLTAEAVRHIQVARGVRRNPESRGIAASSVLAIDGDTDGGKDAAKEVGA